MNYSSITKILCLGSLKLIRYVTHIRMNRHSSIIKSFRGVGGLRPCLFCLFRGRVENWGQPAYMILARSLIFVNSELLYITSLKYTLSLSLLSYGIYFGGLELYSKILGHNSGRNSLDY